MSRGVERDLNLAETDGSCCCCAGNALMPWHDLVGRQNPSRSRQTPRHHPGATMRGTRPETPKERSIRRPRQLGSRSALLLARLPVLGQPPALGLAPRGRQTEVPRSPWVQPRPLFEERLRCGS